MSEQTLNASPAAQATDGLPVRKQVALFLTRCGIMVAVLAVLHGGYTWYLLQGNRYAAKIANGEVVLAITRSLTKTKEQVRKLLLGDSVAKQLYSMEANQDSVQALSCNQAISLAGQYFLLENFLESNPPDPAHPYPVVLIYHPQSFNNNLDELFTYHNFVKNFYTEPYVSEYAPVVQTSLNEIPYKWLARNPFIRTTNWAPQIHFDHKRVRPILSPITQVYLPKIAALCKAKGVPFRIVPPIIAEGKKYRVDQLRAALAEHPDLQPYFAGYFESIKYMPTAAFVDSIHLHKPDLGKDPLGLR